MSPACFCQLYWAVPGHRPRAQNWQQGIGTGFYDLDEAAHATYPIAIVDGWTFDLTY